MADTTVDTTSTNAGSETPKWTELDNQTTGTGSTAEPSKGTEDEDPDAKGSKTKVLADLAAERDARHAAEKQLKEIRIALGLDKDTTGTSTEDLVGELAAQKAENAVLKYTAAHTEFDANALLDSREFVKSLQSLGNDLNESRIGALIEQIAIEGSRFRRGDTGTIHLPGDAGSGRQKDPQSTGDPIRDLLNPRR